MRTLTIEWNAVITLASPERPQYQALKGLVAAHGKQFDLGIVTTAASENTKERELPDTAEKFHERLDAVGLGHITKVLAMGVFDLTFVGLCFGGRPMDMKA